MLEQVLQGLIGQVGQQAVVQNNEVPNQYNQGVMDTVMSGLMGGLSNEAQQPGGMGQLMSLFGGGAAPSSNALMGNSMISGIAQNIIGNLMQRFGLSNSAASGVVASMLPMVLSQLISKTNDSNDSSIDLNGVFGGLTGGKTDGLDLSSLLSGGQAALADGKLDLNDLINLVGNQGSSASKGGGGLMGGLLGSILGK